jgi:hypothetical protein
MGVDVAGTVAAGAAGAVAAGSVEAGSGLFMAGDAGGGALHAASMASAAARAIHRVFLFMAFRCFSPSKSSREALSRRCSQQSYLNRLTNTASSLWLFRPVDESGQTGIKQSKNIISPL